MCPQRTTAVVCLLLFGICLPFGCGAQSRSPDPGTAHDAQQALRSGDYEKARTLYGSLVQASADTSSQYALPYAQAFAATGLYREGLDALSKLDGDDPHVLHAKGFLLSATGQYQDALRTFEEARQQAREANLDLWQNVLALGEQLDAVGRREEAVYLYARIFDRYERNSLRTAETISVAGRAAGHLEKFHAANDAFQTAYRLDDTNLQNLYWQAELFRSKYNEADARQTYREILSINPRHAEALVGMARSVGHPSQQDTLAQRALSVNPNSVEALSLLAELHIRDGLYDEAEAYLQRALDVNPSSIQALAHLASVHHLRGDTTAFRTVERQAMAINEQASSFYVTVADNCAYRFRYPDALAFSQKAVYANYRDAEALETMGTNLLRAGRADQAKQYLSASFDADPFNLFVGNTLTLIDEYAQFDTLETEDIRLVLHREDAEVVGPALLDIAQASYDSLEARYPYRVLGKVHVEAYNDEDDFAVRVAGVPHLGLLGVSFGDVVALRIPQPGDDQPQNWARTLWHEIAHTMAIGVSNHHVPRWFTEGLSVYEERRADPAWGREMDLILFAARAEGKLLPLEDIRRGFSRPSFPGQVQLSYYHASKVIAFIVEEHGFDAIIDILRALGTGSTMDEAIQSVLNQSVQDLDRAFQARLDEERDRLAPVLGPSPALAAMDSSSAADSTATLRLRGPAFDSPFFQTLREGHAALSDEQYDDAEAHFEKALAMYPDYAEPDGPYHGLMAVYRARDQQDALQRVLERFLRVSEYGASEAKELAVLYADASNTADAIRYLERALHLTPHDREVHTRLATVYEQANQPANAARAYRAVIALGTVDEAQALYDLSRNLYADGQYEGAKRAVLRSLEQSPGYRDAQTLLLRCVDALDTR